MACVYMHRNKTNGKVYVGKTKCNPRIRWANGKNYKECPIFRNAIKKYGWDGFEHIILLDGLTNEQARAYEELLIATYRSTDRKYGYNVVNGSPAENGLLGGLKVKELKSKPVCQYDIFGNFIAEYSGVNEAAKQFFGKRRGQAIGQVCNGKLATCGGYIWRFKGDSLDKYKLPQWRTPVDQYTLDGEFIKRFMSLTEAEHESGAKHGDILRCCKGQRRHAKGYAWRFVDGQQLYTSVLSAN